MNATTYAFFTILDYAVNIHSHSSTAKVYRKQILSSAINTNPYSIDLVGGDPADSKRLAFCRLNSFKSKQSHPLNLSLLLTKI
ncbi:hypothetical protein SDJN03_03926, partial [Cucurbita argyrosperma subsp. sororia]